MRGLIPGTVGATALLLAGGAARSQEAVPDSAAEIVRLDAVVTDADGKLVRGLDRDAFELRDDGKVQRLTHFTFVGKGGAGSDAAAQGLPAAGDRASPAPAGSVPPRQVAILVDDLHIATGSLDSVKGALHRLIEELLQPTDNVGLITTSSPGGIRSLTQDRATLEKAIDALSPRQAGVVPARGSQMTAEQAELILRGDKSALLLAGRMIKDEPGSIYEGAGNNIGGPRAAVASLPGANPGGVGEDPAERGASLEAQQQAHAILAEALRFSTASLGRIEDVVRGLAPLPGRKLCLLVSEGFLAGIGTSEERVGELRRIVDAATRSGAVVYALDPRGLVTGVADSSVGRVSGNSPDLQSGVARQAEGLLRATLETVAGDTGGFLIRGTNDLGSGLGRMLEDNEAYYLMAYEPTNLKHDGRFRKIELRLPSHRELTIRTRKGYFAPDDRKLAAAPARGLSEAEGRAALAQAVPPSDALRMSADFVAPPASGPQAVVRAHMAVAGLAWRKADTRLHAALDVVGGAYDAKGDPVGSLFGGRRELDLDPVEYQRAKKDGVDLQYQLPLGAGRYEVRLVARDLEGKTLGGATQSLEIPDLADSKLALSSVFLSSSPSEALGATHTLRRFKPSDQLYFQFFVYNPAVDAGGASDALIQAQIWAQSKVVAASKPQPATLLARDGVAIPQGNGMSLEGLTSGPYELRVVVVDRKANAKASRSVDFTVN